MPSYGDFGELAVITRTGPEEFRIEWRIRDVLSLSSGGDGTYFSPECRFGDEIWYLSLRPNWKRDKLYPASGWLGLGIGRSDGGPPKIFRISVGIRGSGGVETGREMEREFKGYGGCFWSDFCSGSNLMKHKSRLMPDGVFVVSCVLKTPRAARGFGGGNTEGLAAPGARGLEGGNTDGLAAPGAGECLKPFSSWENFFPTGFDGGNGGSLGSPGAGGFVNSNERGLGAPVAGGFWGGNREGLGAPVAGGFGGGNKEDLGALGAGGFSGSSRGGLGAPGARGLGGDNGGGLTVPSVGVFGGGKGGVNKGLAASGSRGFVEDNRESLEPPVAAGSSLAGYNGGWLAAPRVSVFSGGNGGGIPAPNAGVIGRCNGEGLEALGAGAFCGGKGAGLGPPVARGFGVGNREGLGQPVAVGLGEGNAGGLGAPGTGGGYNGGGLEGPDDLEKEVLRAEMEILRQQIKYYVKSKDGYSSEIRSYKSKITNLENKLLLSEKNYEERIQTSLDKYSKLRKDNEQLKKEMESLMEQNKDLNRKCDEQTHNISKATSELTEACMHNEQLKKEMESLMEQNKDLNRKCDEQTYNFSKASSELREACMHNEQLKKEMESLMEQNKDLNRKCDEQTYNISKATSELREACMHNEQLKKEMESLMEQIKTLEITVEDLELKSENYKIEITTLESELMSSAEQSKCQEKLTFASGFEKDSSIQTGDECNDSKFLTEEIQSSEKQGEENYGNNDDENYEESKNKKNLKQMSQIKNTKKISLPARHGSVISSLEAILDGGRRADFTLKSGGREWPVHRAILEGRSGHFETLFRGEWAKRDEVRLDDVAEGALGGVLHFVYAGEVGDMSAENVCGIYIAAHRFLLPDLKSQCVQYMKEGMSPELVCGALVIAETYGEGDLKERALEYYFRESDRIFLLEEWKVFKENHPAIIAELLVETFKRKRSDQGQ